MKVLESIFVTFGSQKAERMSVTIWQKKKRIKFGYKKSKHFCLIGTPEVKCLIKDTYKELKSIQN